MILDKGMEINSKLIIRATLSAAEFSGKTKVELYVEFGLYICKTLQEVVQTGQTW